MRLKGFFIVLALFFTLASCAAGGGVVHTVGKGETLWRICRTYDVDMNSVIRANRIKDPTAIRAGKKLYIPGAKRRKDVIPYIKGASVEKSATALSRFRGKFLWPVSGNVFSRFGTKDGVRNDGIDISVRGKTPVKASLPGKVVYVNDSFRAYGNIIIIEHENDIYTVYAHSKQNIANRGDAVSRGEIIATAGSGDAGGYLHFEVRTGKRPMDPLFFLP